MNTAKLTAAMKTLIMNETKTDTLYKTSHVHPHYETPYMHIVSITTGGLYGYMVVRDNACEYDINSDDLKWNYKKLSIKEVEKLRFKLKIELEIANNELSLATDFKEIGILVKNLVARLIYKDFVVLTETEKEYTKLEMLRIRQGQTQC